MLVRNIQDNDSANDNLTNINSISLNTQAVYDNHVITTAFSDQFHNDNERSKRYLGLDFYNETIDLVENNQCNNFHDNILTNNDSITVNRDPNSNKEVANKKLIEDSKGEGTKFRFNQTLQNYPKISVGNDTYNLTNYDTRQVIDTTIIKYPNTGGYLLQNWIIRCNDRNNDGKILNFIESTKRNSSTGYSRATGLPLIANIFMYIETSSNNHGKNIFLSFERTDTIQISNKTFYYNRFSILINKSLKSMGCFRVQLLL